MVEASNGGKYTDASMKRLNGSEKEAVASKRLRCNVGRDHRAFDYSFAVCPSVSSVFPPARAATWRGA
ncbi:hypothetical protein EVAR_2825_1 [Eumeta japonica]|uniref:Uncharacterized protein n=1 Tax=Eumeta variegata TaxID=151549 RepID=A0A4C1T2E9_EUMVA|nr:hypothetical protein EVAR_2825_1 [Eumeta japonica]